MMINKFNIFLILLIIVFSSCKETVEPDAETKSSPAKNIVINELFRIDNVRYYSHWWLELYNPTDSSINISNWKIVFVNSNLTINLNGQSAITISEKGTFLLITSDKNRFDDYWNVAPLTTLLDFKKIFTPLKSSDEIRLIDEKGNIISMFRYGNYTPYGTNSYPANKSYGNVEEWHSFCRYADPKGAYDSGSSASDFFEESNPAAGYYSQRMKK
jgi:hypothetical protein